MRKMIVLVAGVALATVLATISVASARSSQPKPQVLKLLSKASEINNFVDTGPSGLSPGDLYVFVERLSFASDPTAQIGSADGRCVLIDPSVQRFDCSITSSLPKGTIVTAGTLRLAQGTTSVAAVTGGTGAYRKARGHATVKLGPFEGPHEAAFALILTP